ncbi:MAG: anaerobic ribonucleoside-triphosphate reductase [Coriobacteriaceae bacterium]|nr:anaerobic ribonucleoside-triphosphate reductase [Coriobacteriaceae bacterium]
MNVIKRNGSEVPFDPNRIVVAVTKANESIPDESKRLSELQIRVVAEQVERQLGKMTHAPHVEEIQDLVIHAIMAQQAYEVAQHYTEYRFKKALIRQSNTTDDAILSLVEYENEEMKGENSNKNPQIASTQRDYIAGIVSRDITWRLLLPTELAEAQKQGILHFHDADYFMQHIHNCDLVNLKDMLENGTVITDTMIERPKSLLAAANIATQIVAQVASNQYGGQTFSLAHLAPFVDVSRRKIRKRLRDDMARNGIEPNEEVLDAVVESQLAYEISSAIQTIQYQLITLMTTNGQTPFVSVCADINEAEEGRERADLALLIAEMFRQRIKGIKNKNGDYVTPAFPKILYVLDENNIRPESPYYDLTKLAIECSAKRLTPDYISAKVMRELKNGDVYPCMGCRSFLTPWRMSPEKAARIPSCGYGPEDHRYYGRFNQGVVTINLPDVALSSHKDFDLFWRIFDERLELCHKALRIRHERLLGTTSDSAPILWQHGAISRLKPGELIDPLLYDGYSTLSLGYAGLYEMTMHMCGCSHTEPAGKEFALSVMQHMNDKCSEWKAAENIDYSLYGTPIESTTYTFAKKLQERFGIVKDVTDHNYITNSYHVNVREQIDAFEKLTLEGEFQKLSPGGAVSYVEAPNMTGNLEAMEAIVQHIYDNILYAEINIKSDHCQTCGYDGEILIKTDENGKLVWECPNCGERDQRFLNVARRTCGYIGTQFWNQGRTEEIRDRVLHVSIPKFDEADPEA